MTTIFHRRIVAPGIYQELTRVTMRGNAGLYTAKTGVLNLTPLVLHNIDTKIGVNFNTIYITFNNVGVISNTN